MDLPVQENREGVLNQKSLRRAAVRSTWVAVLFLIAACGGGGDSPSGSPVSPPPPPPVPVTISGVVVGGADATVCVDANGNSTCDIGETSTSTDAQGAFTLTSLAATPAAGTAVVAVIPAGAGGAAYTLKAPAAKANVVSPITSLIQTGVAQGMPLEEAEAMAASQLQVNATNLYSNYATTASADRSALTTIGAAAVTGLRTGYPLVLSALTTSSPDYTVRRFSYTNIYNFDVHHYYWTNVPNVSTGLYPFYVLAHGLLNSAPRSLLGTLATPYDAVWASTPRGWVPIQNEANAHASTNGSPSIAIWGNGYRYVSTRVDTDVSGLSIADVVRQVQDMTLNTESTLIGVTPSQLSGTMPAGARIRRLRFLTVEVPMTYREQDPPAGNGATTVAGVAAAFPMPASPTPTNTVSLGNTRVPLGCTPTGSVCPGGALRASFSAGNVVNYYLCDLDVNLQTPSNCVAAGAGTYAQGTALDRVTPMMTFTNLPAPAAVTVGERALIQRNNALRLGTRALTSPPTITTRLNRVAFEALSAALGIAPPSIGSAISPHLGLWDATYLNPSAGTFGTCDYVLVDAFGAVDGRCSELLSDFQLRGNVSAAGTAGFGFDSRNFTGTFQATSASGTWTDTTSGTSGTWTAMKP